MKRYKTKGFVNAILAAVSYGTNPLFALPMYKLGMSVNSVLFYRYLLAVLIYGIWLKVFKKTSFKISLKEFFSLFGMAILFAFSSVFLFESFNYMDSGLACTILFVYPIIVALISTLFFKEKITKTVILSILITLCGIYLLNSASTDNLSVKGLLFVLTSACSYAIYMVFVKNLKVIKQIKYDKLSFYVMLLGLSVFIFNLKLCTQLQPINDWKVFACAIALAVFPTIISLETINIAIRLVGSTTTAIIGALEPLTAIFFGVLLFSETMTLKMVFGVVLILFGVILIVLRDSFKKNIKK